MARPGACLHQFSATNPFCAVFYFFLLSDIFLRLLMLKLNSKHGCGWIVAASLAWGGALSLLPAQALMAQTRSLPDFTDLVESVGPSVVNIRTLEKARAGSASGADEQMLEFFRRFGIPVPPICRARQDRNGASKTKSSRAASAPDSSSRPMDW